MAERITFSVQLPPVALRRNSETRNSNYRAALVREYQEQVWCAGQGMVCRKGIVGTNAKTARMVWRALPWEKAHLTLTWKHHRMGPDRDNALSSLKALVDVLHTRSNRPLGIIVDDTAERLTVEMHTVKVRTKAEECVDVLIERTP